MQAPLSGGAFIWSLEFLLSKMSTHGSFADWPLLLPHYPIVEPMIGPLVDVRD